MNRFVTFLCLFCAAIMIGLALYVASASAADKSFKDQMLAPVVKLNGNCSGVIVKSEKTGDKVKTTVLTAKHCVADESEGVLNFEVTERGKPIYEKLVWYDVDRRDSKPDLATLFLRDTESVYPVAFVGEKTVAETGDEVHVVGYSLGKIQNVTRGLFTGYQYMDKQSYIQASPDATFGNSGGALFQKNGDRYELIGITSMRYRDNTFMGLFVPLEEIRAFLRMGASTVTVPLPPLPDLGDSGPSFE